MKLHMRSVLPWAAFLAIAIEAILDPTAALAADKEGRPVETNKFLTSDKVGYGGVGLLQGDDTKFDAHALTYIPRDGFIYMRRKPVCTGIIAHRDVANSAMRTFVGLQIIRILTKHPFDGTVYVSRNADHGWEPRNPAGGEKLRPPSEIRQAEVRNIRSVQDFAIAHADTDKLSHLTIYRDPGHADSIADVWHAIMRDFRTKTEIDTAAEEFRRFWAQDPLARSPFLENLPQDLKRSPIVRTDNLLIGFRVTDGNDIANAPTFNFECADPSMISAWLRLYVPTGADPERWYEIRFK